MPVMRFPVAVVMQRVPLANRWSSERWEAIAIELDEESAAGIEPLEASNGASRWRCRGLSVELHPVEAEGYYLNASTEQPRVFVLWRTYPDQGEPLARPLIVSLSYAEAARYLDAGEQVDAVPVPEPLLAAMERFVVEHYKPEPKKKARRNELYEGDESREREARGGRGR